MNTKEVTNKQMELESIYINNAATGHRIRSLCKESGITFSNLADILGFTSQQAVYNWVEGKSKPNVDNFVKLSYLLDVDMNELIVTSRKNANLL